MSRSPSSRSIKLMMKYRFLSLLLTIILLILISPFLINLAYGGWLLSLLSIAVTISAVLTLLKHKSMQIFALFLAFTLVAFNLLSNLTDDLILNIINLLFIIIFYSLTISVLFHTIFTGRRITRQTLIIALNLYLLIGILFSLIYTIIALLEPVAFMFSEAVPSLKMMRFDLLYFSFTTLSTVGFGDIVAISPVAKSFVIIEEVTGVLYIAILVARLVAGLQARK